MARYTGPRTKKSRRYGVPLFGPHKALERRNYPPGMHGDKGRRKQSEYATALGEKQKLRLMYGLLERQFRRYYEIALSRRGVTGETMLQLLETRLDNIVFRLGFGNSRRAARQSAPPASSAAAASQARRAANRPSGSPIQPRAREQRVTPSWTAGRKSSRSC